VNGEKTTHLCDVIACTVATHDVGANKCSRTPTTQFVDEFPSIATAPDPSLLHGQYCSGIYR